MQRFFWLPLGISGLLVAAVLATLVAMSWRNLERLQPVQDHLTHITRIQDVGLNIEQVLLKSLRGGQLSQAEMAKLRQQVLEVATLEGSLYPMSNQRLQQMAERMQEAQSNPLELLFKTLTEVKQVLAHERAQHDMLLLAVTQSTRLELRLAVALLIFLPVAGGVGLLLLQHRTAQPLRDMQDLLDRLAGRDFRPVPSETLDQTTKLAKPAFTSYNALVSRLRELEAEHRDREQLLESRVRDATEALLAQSRELSRAERLAAVGAVSAGFAHELRNPLAGIQLACSKLRKHLTDEVQTRRIEMVINELKRISNLLTDQVDAARHAPETATATSLPRLVSELLGLLRYQVPSGFDLQSSVAVHLRCLLPVAGLRQALLNLVLNAVQIQGESGRVLVSAEHVGDRLLMHVDDDGPGFPDEMLRSGIRPFATGRAGGTGLGLAMVRRFVRELDGDVLLENRSPTGARVTLSLPCRAAPERGIESHV